MLEQQAVPAAQREIVELKHGRDCTVTARTSTRTPHD
jgi:hypothetical protein